MKPFSTTTHRICAPFALALALAAGATAQADGSFYMQHNLVSDGAVPADHVDPILVKNAWGIAFNPFGPDWVADNGSGVSTLYDGEGNAFPLPPGLPLVVQIPSPTMDHGGNPTGIVFNGNPAPTAFAVSQGGVSGSAKFIFATEDGVIAGWAPNVDGTHAIRVKFDPNSGAVYKGLALSAGGSGSLLYASDFHNNKIDVFDSSFNPVQLPKGAFEDRFIPAGFAPFGLQAINGNIYVSYAKQDADKHDDVKGPGLGFVNVFDPNGKLIRRVASRGQLNAPWGMALAPAGFGKFSNRLLVGNFGDGHINAYDLATGQFVGQLKGTNHRSIQIDGLWGLAFGNGFLNQPVNTLFFAAGPNDEADGLYGRIDVVAGNDGDDNDD
jgi:uncharacterized protein (TIGR03118 family)